MNDLRLEFRTRNNILWHAIFDLYVSVAQFCQANNLNQQIVGALLNLKINPRYERDRLSSIGTITRPAGALRPYPKRLCQITGLGDDELFPVDLYSGTIPRAGVAEIPSIRFVALAAAKRLALPPAQVDGVQAAELSTALEEAVSTLTPRETHLIRLRFGLANTAEHTLSEAAIHFGVSVERVRQIERKALHKLRRRSRSEKLKIFLQDPEHVPSTFSADWYPPQRKNTPPRGYRPRKASVLLSSLLARSTQEERET